ncbi:MAG TPA: amidohydrolase family protein [Baekduia sp.]|nr:amidohydrolase family protein [Baekduia sp.]
MIFDAHLHPFPNVFSDTRVSAPGHNLMAPEQLIELFEACGMAGALVLGFPPALAPYIEKVPHAYGLVWVRPGPPVPGGKSFVEIAAEQLDHPKIVGIKLHPLVDFFNPNSPMMDPLYALAAERDVPVLWHSGHEYDSVPWLMAEAAARHPATRFVIAHMGLHTPVYIDAALECAEEYPNLYVDVAAMPYLWRIPEAIERLGEHRVMYGSDAPFFSPQIEIEKIKLCGLPAEIEQRVLATNAIDFYLGGKDLTAPDPFVASTA